MIIQEEIEDRLIAESGLEEGDTSQGLTGEILGHMRELFQQASDDREQTENRWLQSYLAWRGEYSAAQKERIAEARCKNPGASDVYIKLTKTKVEAAKGLIQDIVFSGKEFPIGVESTLRPEGVPDTVHILPEDSPEAQIDDPYGYTGDGMEINPGETSKTLVGRIYENYKGLLQGKKVAEGASPDKTQIPQLHPAQMAAKNMEKTMHDQLSEARMEHKLKRLITEQVMYGTGVLKGPFSKEKIVHNWRKDEFENLKYEPSTKLIPDFEHISVWDAYPDPDASTDEEKDYFFQRHLMNKSQVKRLVQQPFFDKEAIKDLLDTTPAYEEEDWEDILQDNKADATKRRYEVLEFWGNIDADLAKRAGIIDSDYEGGFIQVNIWTSGPFILRAIPNPFIPQRIPYYMVPYEEHPHQLWGIGVPENMSDTQNLINGHMRMAVDNLKLAGNAIIEVNQNQLVPGQDMSLYPGKIFLKQAGAPGQSLYGIKIPDTSQSHMNMVRQVQQFADEETGIPSYAHGQTGVMGTTRTASGMSMLMSAAGLNIKSVVKNIDHYLLRPLGESLFQWNMQFNSEDLDIRGDLNIVARGTKSLMQKEVRTQRLMSFIQIASNPLMAPMLNAREVFREIAILMELDPDKVVNDPEQAKLYAEMIGAMQNELNQGNGPQAGPGNPEQGQPTSAGGSVGGTNPADATGAGGGNIGTGAVPQPSEAGFSGPPQATT